MEITHNIIKGERMSEEQLIISYAIIERTFEKADDAKAQWLMITSISEPAPPKDWTPFCFSEACERGESLGVMSMDKEPCKSCPYRKME